MYYFYNQYYPFSLNKYEMYKIKTDLGSILEDITNDSHRWLGGKDIGVSDHEFFQNIILYSSSQLCLFMTL